MHPEIKQRWVEALRSGQYEQGTERLCTTTPDGYSFCCLGVLTDLAVQDGAGRWLDAGCELDQPTFSRCLGVLPDRVTAWAGLSSDCPALSPAVYASLPAKYLSALNDSHLYTFEQIADLIEADPEL
jgi:hypothetical protein